MTVDRITSSRWRPRAAVRRSAAFRLSIRVGIGRYCSEWSYACLVLLRSPPNGKRGSYLVVKVGSYMRCIG